MMFKGRSKILFKGGQKRRLKGGQKFRSKGVKNGTFKKCIFDRSKKPEKWLLSRVLKNEKLKNAKGLELKSAKSKK